MTPDLDAIRAALAAKKPSRDGATLMRNAPTWLAALCDEVAALKHAHQDVADALMAALAENERLKAGTP